MVTLDGEQVFAGDAVWHMLFGAGTIRSVEQHSFVVAWTRGGITGFMDGGEQEGFANKALFWGVPAIYAPKKGENVAPAQDLINSIKGFKYDN